MLAEFESLLRGLETTLEAAELGARRLTDDELFLEAKRALNPLSPDHRPYRRGEEQLEYRSAREQIVDTSIADETDSYLNVESCSPRRRQHLKVNQLLTALACVISKLI